MEKEKESTWTLSSRGSSSSSTHKNFSIQNQNLSSKGTNLSKNEPKHESKTAAVRKNLLRTFNLRIHRTVYQFYRSWAFFVSRYSFALIAFCVIVSIVCTLKMLKTKRQNNIRGYTPYGSRSLHEFDVRDEFFEQNGTGIRFIAIFVPRNVTQPSVRRAADGSSYIVRNDKDNNGNLLDVDVLEEIIHVDDIIRDNIPIYNRKTHKNESFAQICRLFCDINEPVRAFYFGLRHQMDVLARNGSANPRIQLSYPVSSIFGHEANLLPNFFDVQMSEKNIEANTMTTIPARKIDELRRRVTNIKRIGMIVLLYRAERIGGWTDDDIVNYEMSVHAFFKNNYTSKRVRVLTLSSTYVAQEVDRAGAILRRYVMLGLAIMILCSTITCTLSALNVRQMTVFKPIVAAFACICPFLASGTGLGLLFFMGVRNSSILSVTPFLILAIGVDDAFLTIHAWQDACARYRTVFSIEHRLAIVLEETGPAILISALTNILADVVGTFTGSPEITLLCLANIICLLVDFFFQITFFTAVLVLVARLEEYGSVRRLDTSMPEAIIKNTAPAINIICPNLKAITPIVTPAQSAQKTVQKASVHELEVRSRFARFLDAYAHAVTSIPIAAGICVAWFVFLVFCFQAMFGFEINLTAHKLFVGDSPLLEMETYREEQILPAYTMAQLFVNKPGNLSDPVRKARLDQLVADMEALPYAIGPAQSGTRYFMRDFEVFEASFAEERSTNENQNLNLNWNEEQSQEPEDFKKSKENKSSSEFEIPNNSHFQESDNFSLMKKDQDQNLNEDQLLVWRRQHQNTNEFDRNIVQSTHTDAPTQKFSTADVDVEADLKAFLDWPEYKFWKIFLKYHPADGSEKSDRVVLDTIMIIVGFRGAELKDWYKRAQMLTDWRRVVDRYVDEFNVSVLHDEGLYLDLLENMTTDIWQSLVGTLVCMALICALFMNSKFVVGVATFVIASIMTATLGIIAMQHMTIDPVVMAAVIISLGFSVDIPTHISYHFHVSGKPHLKRKWTVNKRSLKNENEYDNPEATEKNSGIRDEELKNYCGYDVGKCSNEEITVEKFSCERRIRSAFASVGFPAIQASVCMNICILCFLLVPVYIAQVFIRVMCLCSVLCAVHSFVLLPAIFTVVDAISCRQNNLHKVAPKVVGTTRPPIT